MCGCFSKEHQLAIPVNQPATPANHRLPERLLATLVNLQAILLSHQLRVHQLAMLDSHQQVLHMASQELLTAKHQEQLRMDRHHLLLHLADTQLRLA